MPEPSDPLPPPAAGTEPMQAPPSQPPAEGSAEAVVAPRVARTSPVGTWIDHHLYSLLASLGRLLRRPVSSLLTIAVMALALALPLGLWLALANVGQLAGNVQASREISVFLKPDVPLARAQALAGEWRQRSDVARLVFKSPDDGLAELRLAGGLGEALEVVGENPLPSVLIVTPRGDEAALVRDLQSLPEADLVQHDALWRARLDGWLALGRRLAWVLAAVFGVGAVLVVGNTVRLDIQARREEIGVLQLLGATDGFIRRPFLYLGAWYGLGAGVLAIALLGLAAIALEPPVATLATRYGSRFALQGLPPAMAMASVLAAALIGWLGAGMVTGHYLRQTRPGRDGVP